ncbi:Fructose-1,6-bisphosphatase class 1 [Frankliniella fusca]|uniref:Fructose-1,6-bisphosphatase class 1 n=1 Tax=Frankliniella fusca TaxID=407009 RepID=A0AAE1HCT2_9NEOP|nr:Fructose-1,6-bisphosphatase class 1 [Frankliniella fusca]
MTFGGRAGLLVGFQTVLFQVLKEKVQDWDEKEKHWFILTAEIKIPEGMDFNWHNLKAVGGSRLGQESWLLPNQGECHR